MATAVPSPTPNPNALKFTLDITLDTMIMARAGEPQEHPFVEQVMNTPGVIAVFGTNDFVTVNREDESTAWEPIIAVVQAAAAEHL